MAMLLWWWRMMRCKLWAGNGDGVKLSAVVATVDRGEGEGRRRMVEEKDTVNVEEMSREGN